MSTPQPLPLNYRMPPRGGRSLLRGVLGVIGGYLAMSLFVFVTFTGVYLAMGADRAFKPGTYDVSMLWLIVSFVLGFVAAFVGGVVCRLIALTTTAVYVLAGIAVVLGLAMAVGVLMAEPAQQGARTGAVSNIDAMTKAQTPLVTALINPIIAAVGICAGGLFIEKRRRG